MKNTRNCEAKFHFYHMCNTNHTINTILHNIVRQVHLFCIHCITDSIFEKLYCAWDLGWELRTGPPLRGCHMGPGMGTPYGTPTPGLSHGTSVRNPHSGAVTWQIMKRPNLFKEHFLGKRNVFLPCQWEHG